MAKETITYQNTYELVKAKSEAIAPGLIRLDAAHVAQITGESIRTIRRKAALYGFVYGKTTIPKLALGIDKGG